VPPFPGSLTVGLFGSDSEAVRAFGAALGKKGTESDVRFPDKREGDVAQKGTESDVRFRDKREGDVALTGIAPPIVPGEGSHLAILREPGHVRIAGHGLLAGP